MKKAILIISVMIVLAMAGFYFALTKTPPRDSASEDTTPVATSTNNESDGNEQTQDQSSTAIDEKSGIAFSYPENLDYEYISASDWPPRFISSYAPIDCELDEQTQAMSGLTDRTEIINGTSYCIWERNEGAAGSTYTNYQVSYKQANQYVTMSFTLRYPQCGNYPEAEKQACQTEQANFPLSELIDEIAQSTSLPDY